ncbi:MAG: DUF1116 domain-containing protein [Candidatus Eisenbacteria bacterium]|nr:DUF1116 domain-containing protein [Candidatus Eisenbacteria bacterium]
MRPGLLDRLPAVVNIGLPWFCDGIRAAGGSALQVEWRPPALSPEVMAVFRRHADTIAAANQTAVARIMAARPHLAGMGIARDCIPGMTPDTLLHAGPPVTWEQMCGPMRGAVMGALLHEKRAASPDEAERLAASGAVRFAPCHEHAAVGPMAGIISSSMPVFVVEDIEHGTRAHCTMNEGLGKVLRYGAYGADVIERLRWMERTLYPALQAGLERLGAVDLRALIAQALHMGDEVHNRNRAATSLFYRAVAPALVETCRPDTAAAVLRFIDRNDHFFLNLSMAACKASLDAARGIPASSIAVAMARNGTEFGVQVSGTGDAWFTAPAPVPDALFFPGFSKADANPDIGDSAITETGGLGGFAIAAAPAIVQFVGGTAQDASGFTLAMYEITAAEHGAYRIPSLDFRGTPVGIDVIKVARTGIRPFIDTGVAHREPGVGQVGAGVVEAPIEPFLAAAEALALALASPPGKEQSCALMTS